MNEIAFQLGVRPVFWGEATAAFAGIALVLLLAMAWSLRRSRRKRAAEAAAAAERAREMDDEVAELVRSQSEITGRLQTVAEVFGSRQSDFARLISERLEWLQHRGGAGAGGPAPAPGGDL